MRYGLTALALSALVLGGVYWQYAQKPMAEETQISFDGKLSGIWSWSVKEEQALPKDLGEYRPTGTLILTEDKGFVKGVSIIEVPVQENSDKVASMVVQKPVQGTVFYERDGTISLKLFLEDENGKTETIATIDKSDQMTAKSLFKSRNKEIPDIGYNWIGIKRIPPGYKPDNKPVIPETVPPEAIKKDLPK